ncbi:hypothetical protein Tco_1122038 [Tanacetum coccineum]|uniref:Uncharacterized protein n=1 Tax=Tanacetum coccineum TaxID=301880 RepID=A0ABQ5J230_9ASTR
MALATQNFSSSSVIGRCGYGKVLKEYKGMEQWLVFYLLQKKDPLLVLKGIFDRDRTFSQIWRVLELPHEVTCSIALSKKAFFIFTSKLTHLYNIPPRYLNKQHSPNSLAKVADLGLSKLAPLLDDYGVDPKCTITHCTEQDTLDLYQSVMSISVGIPS